MITANQENRIRENDPAKAQHVSLRFSVFVLRFGIQQAAICIHCSLCTPKTVLLFVHFKLGPSAHWGEGSRVLSQQIGVERGRRGGGTAHGVG